MPNTRNGSNHETPSKENKAEEEESSASEEDSYSYDEGESERRKSRCLDDMGHLEHQFSELKELLYKERMQDVELKMNLLAEDSAPEYTNPMKELSEIKEKRLVTSDLILKCKELSTQNKFDQEVHSAQLDVEEGIDLLKMKMTAEIEERIQRLEEEEILSEMSAETTSRKRKSKTSAEFLLLEKRKKPVTVTGPYIVYMLRDMDIMEDFNDIRRGIAAVEVMRRRQSLMHS